MRAGVRAALAAGFGVFAAVAFASVLVPAVLVGVVAGADLPVDPRAAVVLAGAVSEAPALVAAEERREAGSEVVAADVDVDRLGAARVATGLVVADLVVAGLVAPDFVPATLAAGLLAAAAGRLVAALVDEGRVVVPFVEVVLVASFLEPAA
ncbi:MAG: hypothetical protein ACT4OS_03205 [Acidimicrobiales bacterium]